LPSAFRVGFSHNSETENIDKTGNESKLAVATNEKKKKETPDR
jgi:hypothetical protein